MKRLISLLQEVAMFFLLPAFAAAAVSIGEALGIGASVIGIGAAVKGAADYQKAKSIQDKAEVEYHNAAGRVKRKAKETRKKLEAFGLLKLRAYTGIIREAVELLSNFISVDLSTFKDLQIEQIKFFSAEVAELRESVIKASDVLSCLSAGVNTAVHDRFPYKDTPPIFQAIGAFGLKQLPFNGLPPIPYAAITMAGLSWGLSGNAAKQQAGIKAAYVSGEIDKMKALETGFNAVLKRIAEGENLIAALTEKLRFALAELKIPPQSPEKIENAVNLTRALKQIIEVDLCTGNGLLTHKSGVLFRTVRKEYSVTA
jgi:hypothetical protein